MWSTCKAGEHMCRLCDYDVRECRFVDHFVIKTLLELGKHTLTPSHTHTAMSAAPWTLNMLQPCRFFDQKEIIHQLTAHAHKVAATCIRAPHTCLIFINGLRCKRCYLRFVVVNKKNVHATDADTDISMPTHDTRLKQARLNAHRRRFNNDLMPNPVHQRTENLLVVSSHI